MGRSPEITKESRHPSSSIRKARRNPTICLRVVNLAVVNGAGYVEWGYTLGWVLGTNDGGHCGTASEYHIDPFLWVQWQPKSGSPHCTKWFEESQTGQLWPINLKDQNSDTVWSYSYRGTQ
jgi:hypothetical protein